MPTVVPLKRQRILNCLQANDFEQARSLCLSLCKADHNDAELRVLLAFASLQLGMLKEASGACCEAMILRPNYDEAQLLHGYVLQGLGKLAEATQAYTAVLERDPENIQVLNQLGTVYLNRNEPNKAAECYRRALAKDPAYADAHNNLGNAQKALGDNKAAEDSYRAALALESNHALAHYNLGNLSLNCGHYEQAVVNYREALRCQPDSCDAHLNLKLGRHQEAAASLREAVRLNPRQAQGWFLLGAVLGDSSQFDDAIACSVRSLQLEPSNAGAHQNIAQCHKHEGRLSDAQKHFRESLRLNPENADAHRGLEAVLHDMDRHSEAIACYREALRLDPDNTTIPFLLTALGAGAVPQSPPDGYVEALFDEVAGCFDHLLVDELRYSAPALLAETLRTIWHGPALAVVLDLGCGTGLCAPLLRPAAARLDGIDLSAGMLQKASERGVYDRLERADIVEFLQAPETKYDWIIAADVFVYMGALEAVFDAVRNVLQPGGLFGFTVEAADDVESYTLRDTIRYAHGAAYLRRLAQQHGFSEIVARREVLRYNKGEPVYGWIFVLGTS